MESRPLAAKAFFTLSLRHTVFDAYDPRGSRTPVKYPAGLARNTPLTSNAGHKSTSDRNFYSCFFFFCCF